MRRSLMLTLMTWSLLSIPSLAFAAEGGSGSWVAPFAVLAAGIGMGIASGLCGVGQGLAAASAAEAVARQPGAAGRIQTLMIIGLALIESLALYVFVIAAILLFVQPVK